MKLAEQKAIVAQLPRRMWDQRPDETGKAWEAFVLYREMGQVGRGISAVANLLGKQYLVIKRWRDKYDWNIRVAAYDKMLDEHTEKARVEEAKLMGVRHAKLAMGMTEIAQKRVSQIAGSEELISSLTVADVARLAKDGTQIEREARGEDKNTGNTANITFNFNMAAPPKWAPASVVDGAKKAIEKAVIEGNSIPVAVPMGIAGRDADDLEGNRNDDGDDDEGEGGE